MKIVLAALLTLLTIFGASANQMLLGVGGTGAPGMTTPLISDGSVVATAWSNTAPDFMQITGGYSAVYTAATGTAESVIGLAGTISDLTVQLPTSVSAGSWQIALVDNGTITTLTCTISSGTTCAYSGSVPIAAGDHIQWEFIPSTTPAATAQTTPPGPMVTALFTAPPGVNQGPILMGSNGAVTTGSNYYMGPGIMPVAAASTVEVTVSGIIPVAGTIESVWGYLNGTPGASKSYAYTVYHNGSATTLTCTVTGTVSGLCNSSANPFTVAAGDTVSCATVPSGTPTSHIAACGLVWQPNATGQALVFANARAVLPLVDTTEYYSVAGISGPGTPVTTESQTQQLAPTILSGHTLTFGNLYVAQGTVAPSASGRANALRVAGSSVGPHCTINTSGSTGTIGGVASTYYCDDTPDTYSVPSGALVDMQTVDSGTAGSALASFKSTMTAVYQ